MRLPKLAAPALFACLSLSCEGSASDTAQACSAPNGIATIIDYGPPFSGGFSDGWYDVGDEWTGPADDGSGDDGNGAGGDDTGGGAGDDSSGDDTNPGDDETGGGGGDSSGDDTGGGGDDSGGDDSGGESVLIHPTGNALRDATCAACAIACTTTSTGDGASAAYTTTGLSTLGYEDACAGAQRALVRWAHRHAGARVVACRRLDLMEPADPHQPAAPTVGTASRAHGPRAAFRSGGVP